MSLESSITSRTHNSSFGMTSESKSTSKDVISLPKVMDDAPISLPNIVDGIRTAKRVARELPSVISPISDEALPKESFVAEAIETVVKEKKTENATVKPSQAGQVALNPAFVVNGAAFLKYKQPLSAIISTMKPFHTVEFLSGTDTGARTSANSKMMEIAIGQVTELANELARDQGLSLEDAFKKVIGLIDFYDKSQVRISPSGVVSQISTFGVRSATLLASHRAGAGLASWEVYTKGGKPQGNIWPFIENWKNWVPEAQGNMAKFAETTIVKADALAKCHTDETLVLLKGGFGAGKTRQTNEIFDDNAGGVIAPDKGKEAVRRSMKEIPHSAAHVQGSQLAYGLFEELSVKPGTHAYDSSLSRPEDLSRYIAKAEKAGKKVLVIDVQRKDVARILSVLKRDVDGEDPRIPLKMIVEGAIRDKTKRIDCMREVLNHKPGKPELASEYHFIGADAAGWNSKKVAVIKPGKMELLEDGDERLNLQGINYNAQDQILESLETEDTLKEYFNTTLQKSVRDLLVEISNEEREIMLKVFSFRIIPLQDLQGVMLNRNNFHSFLDPSFQKTWGPEALEHAFSQVPDKVIEEFLSTLTVKCESGLPISYLDFPLAVALELHQAIKTDPWK